LVESRTDHCPRCADVREFEQPPCVDGHTADGSACPEWACVDCGAALLIGALPLPARAAAQARSAA
jgi:hypothetical protein